MQATTTPTVRPFAFSLTRGRTVAIGLVQFGVLLACLFAAPFGKRVDLDYWWHLRTGDLILEDGIPTKDPFSWTVAGEPWVMHEWLSQVIIAVIQQAFGYAAVAAFFGAVGCAALAVSYALARRLGAHPRALAMLGLLCIATLGLSLVARPQIFSWLFYTVFLYVLATDDDEHSQRVWLVVPLTLLWANLHLGFTYGLALIGVWCVAETVRAVRGQPVNIVRAPAVLAACLLVSLVNPAGIELLLYPFRYFEDRDQIARIQEWQSPLRIDPVLLPYHLSVLIAGYVLVFRRRVPLFVALAGVLTLLISMTALRNIAYLALVLLPVAGVAWQQGEARITRVPVTLAAATVGAVAICAMAIALHYNDRFSAREPSAAGFPEGGARYIETELPGRRLFNNYDWGGYLIYAAPNTPVYIDGRSDLFRAGLMEEYFETLLRQPGWQQTLDRRGIEVILVPTSWNFSEALRQSGAWDEAFVGEGESVFVRRTVDR
jgi:hypothetical protein